MIIIMISHFDTQVGEVLCRLEIEKRNAVQIENYDTAQKIKVHCILVTEFSDLSLYSM